MINLRLQNMAVIQKAHHASFPVHDQGACALPALR